MNHVPFAAMIVMALSTLGASSSAEDSESAAEARGAECSCYSVERIEHEDPLLNYRTRFTVHGTCLPQTLAFWVHQCREARMESWSDSSVTFSCIPSYEVGRRPGVVKPYPGAPVQFTFEVDVYNPD